MSQPPYGPPGQNTPYPYNPQYPPPPPNPQYQQRPAYGPPPRAYGGEMRERCGELFRDAERLRGRLDREWNPLERSRIEGRLHEVQAQQERDRCR